MEFWSESILVDERENGREWAAENLLWEGRTTCQPRRRGPDACSITPPGLACKRQTRDKIIKAFQDSELYFK